jgi:SAM-dependent methyltransferase
LSASIIKNIDAATVEAFGDEWSTFDQSNLPDSEQNSVFDLYFSVFPWSKLPANAEGFDMGCGSGRWAKLCAPKVGTLNCIDPAEAALNVARKNLAHNKNVKFHHAGVDDEALAQNSQDFGYSLGVLHHIPDTAAAMRSCVKFLKPGAPFLVYLYYSLDNRPGWFRAIWQMSNLVRFAICKLPNRLKLLATDVIAALVYWPLSRFCKVAEHLGLNVKNIPLYAYKDTSFYSLRTNSRDRFGTPLEQRFSRVEIQQMMHSAGLMDVTFSEELPYWCAVGYRKM